MLQVVQEGSACVSQDLGRPLYVGTLHVRYRCWGVGQCMYVEGVGADFAYVLQVSSRMFACESQVFQEDLACVLGV